MNDIGVFFYKDSLNYLEFHIAKDSEFLEFIFKMYFLELIFEYFRIFL